ncbi:hypothetical protein M092_1176 [Parabacteroides distasonis str. 3776 D15 iv]|uniref:Uncharacterized protein n=1 Tax=Parabacteroides distasonis str. 3776 D15 i TaxID=1339342 RepID=A0AB34LIH4_PARDI|nr:hypothetical protein M091_4536 [Parabacteroides distasonis str. 3776 D15 i]KDS45384.1 hypothetical protein M090_4162 [Parabacteroides distasonis str. 3776 Po2 i]KDS72423.1 hypothetical protein M092_1176 [Parabacteroides distasonis str. 3776 D15 iv]DAL20273.1 MAG TPA_asm: protein of unknown function DUF1611 [Caudoviricetes sp.]
MLENIKQTLREFLRQGCNVVPLFSQIDKNLTKRSSIYERSFIGGII